MVRISYSLSSFDELLRLIADQTGSRINEDVLQFSPSLGEGYLRAVSLPNGLNALIGDFTLRQAMLAQRTRSTQEYYVFICDIVEGAQRFYVDIDRERVELQDEKLSVMYLLSFLSDLSQFATAGTRMKTLRVIISRDWMAKYLKVEVLDDVLRRYLALKAGSVHVKEIDFESMRLLEDILHPPKDTPMEKAFVHNRIMMLLENFFEWLYRQMSVMELKIKMSREEIDLMRRVEEMLVADLANPPTIAQLAREAAMSPSKLKKQFKDVFGLPIYEYFQKQRMQQARELLLDGHRSVKSVGIELGFSNLSNFSMAFRKEFGVLPSELLKTIALT